MVLFFTLPNPSGSDQRIDGLEVTDSTSRKWLEIMNLASWLLSSVTTVRVVTEGKRKLGLVWTPRANHTLPLKGIATMMMEDERKKGGFTVLNGSATPRTEALFSPGVIHFTPSALQWLPEKDFLRGLVRHLCGDWGNLDRRARKRNDLALKDRQCVMSRYRASDNLLYGIVTEWDQSCRPWTTVFLPKEH